VTVQYLTVDGVIELHEIALEYGGGLNGIRSQQTLASAVGQAEASAFGEDAYPTKAIDQSEFFGWVCNHARPQR